MQGLLEQEKFKAWRADFTTQRFGYIRQNDKEGSEERVPNSETFEQLDEIQLAIGTTDMLRDNILLACYNAQSYPEDREVRKEESRKHRESIFFLLPEQEEITNQTIRFLSANNNFALDSMRYGSHLRDPNSENESLLELQTLKELLIKFSLGLKRLQNPEHPVNLDFTLESEYGPFILPRLNKETSKHPISDIRRIGLIFNLVYVFRYFTGFDQLKFPIPSNLKGNELIISGEMLHDIGEPSFGLVAAFTNAALTGKLSRRKTQEKLRDFLALPDSNLKVAERFSRNVEGKHRDVQWAGWPSAN